MTQVKMRIAKQELHKAIVDIILSFDDTTNEEMNEMWAYVKHLAECELSRNQGLTKPPIYAIIRM